ncbi:MAG: penicillin acylase family protein [Gemmatimonadetes bacterium]|nr:penicillin acylase family protein [Gemmatimonadota bacterium]
MGTFRMGSPRVTGRVSAARVGWRALAARVGWRASACPVGPAPATGLAAAFIILVAGCGSEGASPERYAAYAEIVAEEDARGGNGLDRVHGHLPGDDPAVRAMAVRALGRMEDPGELGRMSEVLDDPDPGVRAAVATAMAQAVYGDDPGAAWAALTVRSGSEADPAVMGSLATSLGRLTYSNPEDRDAADRALASVAARLPAPDDDPGLVARLGLARGIEAITRGSRGEHTLSAELLDATMSLSSVSPAGDAGSAPDDGRALAAMRIRRLATAALVHTGQLAAADAVRLLEDPDWGVRRQVVIGTARHGTAAGTVIPAGLADPDPHVRVEALRAYERWTRPEEGCATILRAMDDGDPHVEATAIGLAASPCPDAEPQRRALAAKVAGIDDPDADWRGPVRALHALAGIAPGDAGDGVALAARHTNPFVRAWAARAAALTGDAAVLTALSDDSDANVREAALRGLVAVAGGGGPDAHTRDAHTRDAYTAALESDDPQLVMTATRLLVEHGAGETSVPALLAALARFTAAQRETERDARVALLDGIGAVGGFSSDDLAPYLADFDPVVADKAAALLTGLTGTVHEAAPRRLRPAPTPGAARLAELERSAVRLHMAGLGDIVIALRPDLAATNADRFARLASEGYFDGLTFHRVEPNFVIQGGSPHANEYAGDGPYSRDEISDQAHWRGTVGLSTRGRDTGDAQIFINLTDNVRLDFNYTIYGEVVEGMEIVDAVQEGAVIERAEVIVRSTDPAIALARRVEIHRTEYGIPHILAEDLEAMGFGLGYVQSEDYGASIAAAMVTSRGTLARHLGPDELDADFVGRDVHARAVETFQRLHPRTRDVYRGFAEGVNHYIRLHPDEFPPWVAPDFTGIDALARDVQTWSRADAARFVAGLDSGEPAGDVDGAGPGNSRPGRDDDSQTSSSSFALDGSNAWAFHGTRTESGNTILLRNPHLRWDGDHDLLARPSGLTYYEAHVRVPGVIDFYGDFRIGTAFGIIGGFNARLGWATTNNYPTLSQVYKLGAHPTLDDHALLDGRPLPLERRDATVDYRTETAGSATETRTTWHTPHGPVVHRTEEHVYVLKDARDGEFRRGEQFLHMMMAEDLDEWLDVMKMRAHPTSNFTYADRDGNIVHYYNVRLPLLPHPVTGDTAALAATSADIWSELVPWESLPLYINPPGGYVQQANDTPDYTNLNVPMDRDTVPANLPEPRLRLRSQLSLELASGARHLSIEDVIELKHNPRMLMAERLMDDLLGAAMAADDSDVRDAAEVLSAWDLTAAADSRGGVLFGRWADRYFDGTADSLRWRQPWDPARAHATPYGIGDPDAAVDALRNAVRSLRNDGIKPDAPWGDVHRVIRGDVDEPVSGCPPARGCFRVLLFEPTDDSRLAANRGDSWVFVVEFGEVPTARTVLAYGQTARHDAPHYADQAAMFARGQMKEVARTDADIRRKTIRVYRPGTHPHP